MKQVGDKLRAAREEKGYSVTEISMATKISPRVVKAIEEGDITRLPPKTFLRGFIRAYAQHLKLDTNEIMALFQEESGDQFFGPKPVEVEAGVNSDGASGERTEGFRIAPSDQDARSSRRRQILVVAVVCSLLLFIIFVWTMVNKYEREKFVDTAGVSIDSPSPVLPAKPLEPIVHGDAGDDDLAPKVNDDGEENAHAPPASGSPTVAPSAVAQPAAPQAPTAPRSAVPAPPAPATASRATVPPSPATPASPPTTPPTKPSPTTPPAAVAVVAAKPQPSPQPSPQPRPQQAPSPQPASQPTQSQQAQQQSPPSASATGQELIIEALDGVEITYQIDDGPAQTTRLKADQVKSFRAGSRISLKLNNGGAVSIIHNGKDKGVPGDLGRPIQLQYP